MGPYETQSMPGTSYLAPPTWYLVLKALYAKRERLRVLGGTACIDLT